MKREPRKVIVEWLGVTEHVLTSCPHCGCNGRKVYHFLCSDGKEYGAMSGCVKKAFWESDTARNLKVWRARLEKYPGWRVAERHIELLERERDRLLAAGVAR